jgi:hypothetical protein
MNTEKLKFCSHILARMDNEVQKRDEIYKHGVDLANYENEYFQCLMDSLIFILEDESFREDIEWYLFEKPRDNERYYVIDGEKVSVEDPKTFLTINFNLKNNMK